MSKRTALRFNLNRNFIIKNTVFYVNREENRAEYEFAIRPIFGAEYNEITSVQYNPPTINILEDDNPGAWKLWLRNGTPDSDYALTVLARLLNEYAAVHRLKVERDNNPKFDRFVTVVEDDGGVADIFESEDPVKFQEIASRTAQIPREIQMDNEYEARLGEIRDAYFLDDIAPAFMDMMIETTILYPEVGDWVEVITIGSSDK